MSVLEQLKNPWVLGGGAGLAVLYLLTRGGSSSNSDYLASAQIASSANVANSANQSQLAVAMAQVQATNVASNNAIAAKEIESNSDLLAGIVAGVFGKQAADTQAQYAYLSTIQASNAAQQINQQNVSGTIANTVVQASTARDIAKMQSEVDMARIGIELPLAQIQAQTAETLSKIQADVTRVLSHNQTYSNYLNDLTAVKIANINKSASDTRAIVGGVTSVLGGY